MESTPLSYPYIIEAGSPYDSFPEPHTALSDPDGLLAIGGDLQPSRLLYAYRNGIFPWYNEGQPILWWSPDPRTVLFPDNLKISRSLHKSMRNKGYRITFNQAFPEVIQACAAPRQPEAPSQEAHTWLTGGMIEAYRQLASLGYIYSTECWLGDTLVGGLYGIRLGQVFFGESMFSTHTDASKVAFVQFVQHFRSQGGELIDCQMHSGHLVRLGAQTITRWQFLNYLRAALPA